MTATPVKIFISNLLYNHLFFLYKILYFYYKHHSDLTYIQIIQKFVKKDMIVVDIGANIGFFTQIFSQLVGPMGHVYSFEPNNKNFSKLKNLMSSFPYVILEKKAISDKTGSITLFESSTMNVDHRTYNPNPILKQNRKVMTVPCVTLDDYFHPNQPIHFIKMDIQGAEVTAIKGMDRILRENKKICIGLELWPFGLKSAGSNTIELINLLLSYDFKIQIVNEKDKSLVPFSSISFDLQQAEKNPNEYFNIVCFR